MRAGTVGVTIPTIAHHVKQAALVGIGLSGTGKIKSHIDRIKHGCAVLLQGIKRTGFDQGFDRAFVDLAALYPHAKIKQAGEGAARFTRCNNRFHRLLPCPFDGPQPIANHGLGHRLKAVHPTVHIRWLKSHSGFPHDGLLRVLEQNFQLVGVAHLNGHVGAEELGRVMHLQPGGVVGQERIGSGMGLVKAIAGKLLHQVEYFVGFVFQNIVFGRPIAEYLPMLGHLIGVFFTHRTAQHVGAAKRVATQNLCRLHHLLLVDHDAVGL